MTPPLTVRPDADAVADAAAARVRDIIASAVRERGRCAVALSGGTTPERLYRRLAAGSLPDGVHFFFGDERFVPPDYPASNFGMAARALFRPAGIPPERVNPVPTDWPTPAAAAAAYAATLAAWFGVPASGPPPAFDLILLGLGDDGHTASLFPDAAALAVTDAWVTWSPPGTPPPPVDRVTLTLPTLNAARHVLFLVSGANKAAVLLRALSGPNVARTPASGVRGAEWIVDAAAAGH